MSDLLRQSSPRIPVAGSPGRPSPLSRPHWPWSTYTHRSASSASVLSTSSSLGSQGWDSRSAALASPSTVMLSSPTPRNKRNSGMSTITYHNSLQEETTTRQWSFSAFEWVVRDAHRLRDFVESPEPPEPLADTDDESGSPADDFEILKESPVIGDGKFKLEIAKTPHHEQSDTSTPIIRTQPQSLSIYITSLLVDFSHAEYEMPSSMFAAIKCQDDRVGERGARAEWAWEYWHEGWVFRQESEVWECPLPPLSSLLENPRIKETDSFVICVQMHSPVGPFFPQQPAAYYVPRDLLDGLEASLDNPNTGDVRFVCLERKDARQELSDVMPGSPSTAVPMSASSISSSPSSGSQTVARKRIIYAHSDILTRRSEYFATMLGSAFSENATGVLFPGDRKMYTILVEEADYVTIYWLLKFVYANWVLFRKEDDPREAVDGSGAGWSARGFSTPGAPDEWEWKPLAKNVSPDGAPAGASDTRSVTSAGSVRSGTGSAKEKAFTPTQSTGPVHSTGRNTVKVPPGASPARPPVSPARRAATNPSALTVPMTGRGSGTKPVPVPISPSRANYTSPPRHPLSPRQRVAPMPDPHAHPAPAPVPASALCMYQVAHRYGMPGLAALALEHILWTITPQSSFAVLLATATWEELHTLVEDYVVEKWGEVSVSDEFERCCEEVASGEWGPEGGKTLMAMFRRLRSPSAYVRA